jgi:hypothetical protein
VMRGKSWMLTPSCPFRSSGMPGPVMAGRVGRSPVSQVVMRCSQAQAAMPTLLGWLSLR